MSSDGLAWCIRNGHSFLVSLQFLTIIPVPTRWLARLSPSSEHETEVSTERPGVQTGALVYYPLVGVIIGGLLLILISLLTAFSSFLSAVVLLTAWVIITGALHLDGLADSADAWLGGHGDKARTLLILKDTHSGVAAVLAIVLLLLLKLACLNELDNELLLALFFAPVLARVAVVYLLMTTDYVRESGIAAEMMASLAKKKLWTLIIFIALVVIVALGWNGLVILLSIISAVLIFRYMIIRRIGGTTGDTAGALIELIELLILFDFVIIGQWA